MTISVIVPAAGCGARAALNGNKILANLRGKPLLWWTIRALAAQTKFAFAPESSTQTSSTFYAETGEVEVKCDAEIVEIVLSVRDEERETVRAIYDETGCSLPLIFARGGATRADSVRNATQIARGDFVLVHDAARPCLPVEVTARVVESALKNGAAIAALPADDTVKRVIINAENAEISIAQTLERSEIFLAQTPQMFRRELLQNAFEDAEISAWQGTDCASYVECFYATQTADYEANRVLETSENSAQIVEKVAIVRGDSCNLKVTYADDLKRAARWIEDAIS